jgi:uncharacterized membrane protein YfhO
MNAVLMYSKQPLLAQYSKYLSLCFDAIFELLLAAYNNKYVQVLLLLLMLQRAWRVVSSIFWAVGASDVLRPNSSIRASERSNTYPTAIACALQ